MATTPPVSPSTSAEKTSHVQRWIEQLCDSALSNTNALSPPLSPNNSSLKRKRTRAPALCSSTMSARTTSPKRPRRETEILPTHSISVADATSSASPLALNERNTFSPSGSQTSTRTPRRANSPSRDNIAVLATACPPTITEPSSGLKKPPPTRVTDVMERLEEGLEKGWIPNQLRNSIEEDVDFGYQRIEQRAWTKSTVPGLLSLAVGSEERDVLLYTLRKVKEIWLDARTCQSKGRDENAWCMDVVERLVKLAIKLEGKDKFWLQSVQSQAINTAFLSSVSDTTGKLRVLDRKADFTLSFSHKPSPGFEDLYNRLRSADNSAISHMADAFTKTTALFSGIEVKPANGDLIEAEYQISIWMAASLRKKMQLARCAGLLDKSSLVEPCFVVVGHETHIYFAYMASEDVVRIQGPEHGFLGSCETRSVSGIFRTLQLWRNVVKYGRDESTDGFWGGFMGVVLQKLAGHDEE